MSKKCPLLFVDMSAKLWPKAPPPPDHRKPSAIKKIFFCGYP